MSDISTIGQVDPRSTWLRFWWLSRDRAFPSTVVVLRASSNRSSNGTQAALLALNFSPRRSRDEVKTGSAVGDAIEGIF
jgi:hypothetical protein